jgi:hypothetical protein
MEHVYDYKSHRAAFYVVKDYAYGSDDHQAQFWIKEAFWYPATDLSRAALYRRGKYLYSYPSGSTPAYYFL